MGNETRLKKLENAGGSDEMSVYFVDWGEGENTLGTVHHSDGRKEEMTLAEFRERYPDKVILKVEYEDTPPRTD